MTSNSHLHLLSSATDVVGRRARKEIERLCSDNKAGEWDGKEERENLKN
jgi:hypothetical protein